MAIITKKLPNSCPSCDKSLRISELSCKSCDTHISGSFEMPLLATLTEEEQAFVVEFIKSSGSIKDMAKQLGLSYPTVRNILNDLIDKLIKKEKKWKR